MVKQPEWLPVEIRNACSMAGLALVSAYSHVCTYAKPGFEVKFTPMGKTGLEYGIYEVLPGDKLNRVYRGRPGSLTRRFRELRWIR